MKFWWKLWVPFLILPLFVLASDKGDAIKGKEVFANRCAVCHGESGKGKEAIAKMFNVTMKNLGSEEVQSIDDATLKKDILEGNGKMRPVRLTDQEAADVIAFIHTLKK